MMNGTLTPARRSAIVVGLGVSFVISASIGVMCGPDGFSASIFSDSALLPLRLLRIGLAGVAGAALASTGAALQALLKNPLADPYVLGVSGGAAMSGALAVALGAAATGLGLSSAAALGALGASALLAWFLARDSGGRSETALLVGVTLNAFAWALVSVVRAALPAEKTQILSVWLVGSVGYPSVNGLIGAAVATSIGVLLLVFAAGDLGLLRLGEDEASRLGVNLRRSKLVAYGAASLLVGVAVSTTGVIGFVGLIAPHAVRLMFGSDERVVVPASALMGATSLVAFDALARLSFSWFASEVPTGALTALIGAPIFAIGLWRRVTRRRRA